MNLLNLMPLASSSCPAGADLPHYFRQFEFVRGIICQFTDSFALPILALIVFGGIFIAMFIRQGSPIIPFVFLLLTGGAVMSMVAGVAVALVSVVTFGVIGGSVTWLYYKHA